MNKMNLLIVLGVVLVGVGTYLTILGSLKKSSDSESKILSEIEKTRNQTESRISEILDTTKLTKDQQEEIQNVRNEFDDWAADLKSNLEKRKIELQKLELSEDENNIELNSEYRFLYENFFYNMRSIIDAINKNTEYNIQYNIPNLPDNIFKADYKEYIATVDFKNNIQWNISFGPLRKSDRSVLPTIWFTVTKSNENYNTELDLLGIFVDDKKKDYGIALTKNNYLNFNSFDFKLMQAQEFSEEEINDFTKRLLELQIITEY